MYLNRNVYHSTTGNFRFFKCKSVICYRLENVKVRLFSFRTTDLLTRTVFKWPYAFSLFLYFHNIPSTNPLAWSGGTCRRAKEFFLFCVKYGLLLLIDYFTWLVHIFGDGAIFFHWYSGMTFYTGISWYTENIVKPIFWHDNFSAFDILYFQYSDIFGVFVFSILIYCYLVFSLI